MRERTKHQSTDPTLWLQVFSRYDVQGNKSGGLILHRGHESFVVPFKQAAFREIGNEIVEEAGGQPVTWGMVQEQQ